MFTSCAVGFVIEGLGCLGMWYFVSFRCTLFFTLVRAAGSCISWVDGLVLLQVSSSSVLGIVTKLVSNTNMLPILIKAFAEPKMLGRVIAIDTGFSTTAEGISALIAGVLQDYIGLSARQVSAVFGGLAYVFFVIWTIYGFVASKDLFERKDYALSSMDFESSENKRWSTASTLTESSEEFVDYGTYMSFVDFKSVTNTSLILENGDVCEISTSSM